MSINDRLHRTVSDYLSFST